MPASDAWWPQGKRVYNTDLEYLKLFNEAAGARSQKEVSPEWQYIFTYTLYSFRSRITRNLRLDQKELKDCL